MNEYDTPVADPGGPWGPRPPFWKCKRAPSTKNECYPPPSLKRIGYWRPREICATTPPPPLKRIGYWRPREICATTPPPLKRIGYWRPRKISATTPPPPLNRIDLARDTKGAPSLGKSWICDCTHVCVVAQNTNRRQSSDYRLFQLAHRGHRQW